MRRPTKERADAEEAAKAGETLDKIISYLDSLASAWMLWRNAARS